MGNLPVIPRTAAKRAICLINSLFCHSPAGPHPSTCPIAHYPPADSERREAEELRGATETKTDTFACIKKGKRKEIFGFLLLTPSILAAGPWWGTLLELFVFR